MAVRALKKPETVSTDIVALVAQNPVVVLRDENARVDLYAHIRREVEAFVPDLTTKKGRDAITSLAFKITRTKTAIDAAGKKLNEEARAQIGVVDAARRDARETLDAMVEQVKAPLEAWKAAEDARISECRVIIAGLREAAVVTLADTAATVRQRGTEAWNTVLDANRFGDLLADAETAKADAVATLKTALTRLTQEEADRAELERLRAAEVEREVARQAEEAERIRRENAAREAREAEERRVAAEQAEAERIAAAERAAEERARQAEAQAAREREAERQRQHDAELAAERARAEEAERAAQAERDRVAAEEAARVAEAERLAAEQRRRDADQAHRTKVKSAAKQALMTCGADEETARKIVVAILAGEVPHVSMRF